MCEWVVAKICVWGIQILQKYHKKWGKGTHDSYPAIGVTATGVECCAVCVGRCRGAWTMGQIRRGRTCVDDSSGVDEH